MVSRTRLDECENREDAEERLDDRDPGSHPGSHQAPLPLPNNGKEDIMDDQGVRYSRLTKADRRAIEAGLASRKGCREIARSIGRAPSTVADEVKRNRTWAKKGLRGMRVGDAPIDEKCAHLASWPWVCNGCFTFPRACGRKERCEYSAIYAQALADSALRDARRGINAREEDFERVAFTIRSDLARGLSPQQICAAHPHLRLAPSTLYRWISRGYFGMSNMDLRRQVGYKPRREKQKIRPTSHGKERSYAAFLELADAMRDGACEMDTVIGRARDGQCLLTLYLRPCKLQLALLLRNKAPEEVAGALDMLEEALGGAMFRSLFGCILTDNGTEFCWPERLERSRSGGKRCRIYYCDVRASQQKAACERNHVELRKILPKGRNIAFDELDERDCSVLMSHMNSQPRPSLMGLSPLAMMRAAMPDAAEAIMCALGMEEVPYEKLDMTLTAINADREARGMAPLG